MPDLEIFPNLEQGTDAWLNARCGLITASTIGQLITPNTIKPASNDKSRALIQRLAAERITRHVEDTHQTRDMLRGTLDEPYARYEYEKYAQVRVDEIGFMVRNINGHRLGYSPDGLVNDDGLIEIKSRNQHTQVDTFVRNTVPPFNMAQLQTGLLVSGRDWIDYVSYSGGMPLYVKRIYPDTRWEDTIITALAKAEDDINTIVKTYEAAAHGLTPVPRIDHFAEPEFV